MFKAGDRHFIKALLVISLPLTLQSIMFSSKGLADVLMLGQLSEASLAGIGVATRAFFIATFVLYAVASGGGVLLAQYWGKQDHSGFTRTMALTTWASLLVAMPLFGVFYYFPEWVVSLASSAPEVIEQGAIYLKITAAQLIVIGVVSSFAAGLRSIHKANISTTFSVLGLLLNIGLNYVLIFGHFGVEAMGIEGAAWATLLSAFFELLCLIAYTYWRRYAVAFSLTALKNLPQGEVSRLMRLSVPIALNMVAYAGGLFTYSIIFGRMSTEALAIFTLMSPIESIAISLLISNASATAVLLGNELGSEKTENTYRHSWLAVTFSAACAVVTAAIMLASADLVIGSFEGLSAATISVAHQLYPILAIGIIIRSLPITMIIGVLRSGGDNTFCLYQDVIAQWVIGIPTVLMLAFYFEASLLWVFAAIFVEEIVKIMGSVYRISSRLWMRNLISDESDTNISTTTVEAA
ncbi:MATE family efflux transporter [Motilimonas cestriensis]|uniref:MATE family efflux transporter n=1 Tax=Motilimonas cestriensis TaxID=2742685 RepID=UPI003DA3528E